MQSQLSSHFIPLKGNHLGGRELSGPEDTLQLFLTFHSSSHLTALSFFPHQSGSLPLILLHSLSLMFLSSLISQYFLLALPL